LHILNIFSKFIKKAQHKLCIQKYEGIFVKATGYYLYTYIYIYIYITYYLRYSLTCYCTKN